MTGGIGEIHFQYLVWMGDTWVLSILSMLKFLTNYKIKYKYKRGSGLLADR